MIVVQRKVMCVVDLVLWAPQTVTRCGPLYIGYYRNTNSFRPWRDSAIIRGVWLQIQEVQSGWRKAGFGIGYIQHKGYISSLHKELSFSKRNLQRGPRVIICYWGMYCYHTINKTAEGTNAIQSDMKQDTRKNENKYPGSSKKQENRI